MGFEWAYRNGEPPWDIGRPQPAIAATALSLPSSFPGDPADRLIYATAIENGWPLVTKDQGLRKHRHPHPVAVW